MSGDGEREFLITFYIYFMEVCGCWFIGYYFCFIFGLNGVLVIEFNSKYILLNNKV